MLLINWRNRRGQALLLAAIVTVLYLLIGILSLMIGIPRVTPVGLWAILHGEGTALPSLVVTQLRLPRFVLGTLAGIMLALSGALLQGALQNALAGPELLGVTAGSTVVVAAITILHLTVTFSLIPVLALAGGLLGGSIITATIRQAQDPMRFVLTGAALTALLNSFVIVLMSLGSQNDTSLLFLFLVGSLANRTWQEVNLILPWAAIGIPLAFLLTRALNVLQLGEGVARGLGLHIFRLRLLILILSTALVAAIVAVCGPISFIALLSPHVARRLLRTSDARFVLPFSALIGAVLLCGADLLARLVFEPQELPVGLWTTLLGGPFLLLLLKRQLGQKRGAD